MKQPASKQPTATDFVNLIKRNKALEIEARRSSNENVKRPGSSAGSAKAFGLCFHDQGR